MQKQMEYIFFVENLKDFKNQFDKILDIINKIDPSTKFKFSDHLKNS